ncbi:DUF4362 domain-containing protein [Paenibacillus mendelii]|uniref:DUF4362 domain-containing protein n=1 Tax=Paenibacillus mendelii TaxID=206163 RepID=A0ABV6J2F9_9BACL|nr:DUF4362 domain-containing protein [Paenibacillus mendelii]MCQ6563281.1 DUF4362 domain-containing protein [Paenibacillus mendelii]
MSNRMYIIALILIVLLSACSSKPYNYDTAIANGDIVNLHGQLKNVERLQEFYQNISQNKKDDIRITQFTEEGDPIFYDLEFNGEEIKYTYDTTKDNHGKNRVRSTTCKTLIATKIDTGVEYTLEGCFGKNTEVGENFQFLVK